MTLALEPYASQLARWPATGKHILAQFDAESIVVYQAYPEEIGRFAAAQGRLGGPAFSFERMSWIKPNFLWMMYRSGWGTKPAQEVILAIRIARIGFDHILELAVPSSFGAGAYATHDDWQAAVTASAVRLQWDPDHDPVGAKCERRAIQLGLRGEALRQLANEWTLEIEDVSQLVRTQWSLRGEHDRLMTPREDVYPVANAAVAARLGISPPVR